MRLSGAFTLPSKRVPKTRKKPANVVVLLRFAKSAGRLTVCRCSDCSIRPCPRPANLIRWWNFLVADKTAPPDASTVPGTIRAKIDPHLQELCAGYPTTGVEDEAYWAAPIMLDLKHDLQGVKSWWQQPDPLPFGQARPTRMRTKPMKMKGEYSPTEHGDGSVLVENQLPLDHKLGRPPADLSRVLALLAMGGPAIQRCGHQRTSCIAPATKRLKMLTSALRNGAGQSCWAFGRLFNLPEAMMILRGLNRAEPYWFRAPEYQKPTAAFRRCWTNTSMFCVNLWGLLDKPAMDTIGAIAEATVEAISLRTASLSPGITSALDQTVCSLTAMARACVFTFAVRFGDESPMRRNRLCAQVRFALRSTHRSGRLCSQPLLVGQEGWISTFHCHAVVIESSFQPSGL